jgi:hypothetical protein
MRPNKGPKNSIHLLCAGRDWELPYATTISISDACSQISFHTLVPFGVHEVFDIRIALRNSKSTLKEVQLMVNGNPADTANNGTFAIYTKTNPLKLYSASSGPYGQTLLEFEVSELVEGLSAELSFMGRTLATMPDAKDDIDSTLWLPTTPPPIITKTVRQQVTLENLEPFFTVAAVYEKESSFAIKLEGGIHAFVPDFGSSGHRVYGVYNIALSSISKATMEFFVNGVTLLAQKQADGTYTFPQFTETVPYLYIINPRFLITIKSPSDHTGFLRFKTYRMTNGGIEWDGSGKLEGHNIRTETVSVPLSDGNHIVYRQHAAYIIDGHYGSEDIKAFLRLMREALAGTLLSPLIDLVRGYLLF